jgi:hypothetical protein
MLTLSSTLNNKYNSLSKISEYWGIYKILSSNRWIKQSTFTNKWSYSRISRKFRD